MEDYSYQYSEQNFWDKIKKFSKKAGCEVIYAVLLLFYALQNPSLPIWARTVIIGAIGYFISPIDAIPDITPVGFTDDLGTIVAALGTVALYINADTKEKARTRLQDWFNDGCTEGISKVEQKLTK
ncbi:YkvA family protein [Tepidibacillus sp. LV47]|uniref:YkvA family protein n=1 Tax=Tepidibacillus sp. LV47 TaxID=3398228 RepID=UPI003AAFD33F